MKAYFGYGDCLSKFISEFDSYDWSKACDSLADQILDMYSTTKRAMEGIKYTCNKDDDKYIYEVVLPGVDKEDLGIEYKKDSYGENTLYIEVKKDCAMIRKNTYRIHLDSDIDGISSVLKNGILTITVNRKTMEKQTINIKVE